MSTTMIDRYLDEHTAEPVTVSAKDEQRKIEHLTRAKARLFPAESDALVMIEQQIRDQRDLLGRARLAERYPQLSLEPLSWRHDERLGGEFAETPLPVFAVVNVFSDDGMRISALWADFRPVFNNGDLMYKIYDDVRHGLTRTGSDIFTERRAISWWFTGVIPATTRDRIMATKDEFSPRQRPEVFLICETKPQDWEGTVTLADPLVVGYAHNSFWLIDRFDPTSLESYVEQEFTS